MFVLSSYGLAQWNGDKWIYIGNVSGDFTSPTNFYGVVGNGNIFFSCGDFASFGNARFSFTRIF